MIILRRDEAALPLSTGLILTRPVVALLNRILTDFDHVAEKHGLEKIKTIGNAYMVAAGIPTPCSDPIHRIADMAIDMLALSRGMSDAGFEDIDIRIGLNCGPAVVGVIGRQKPFYDVWSETVNTASRMESHGEPGRIQTTGRHWRCWAQTIALRRAASSTSREWEKLGHGGC